MTGPTRHLIGATLALVLGGAVLAQPAAVLVPDVADTRLAVSTLVREDLFAGWLDGDMTRHARGEANLEKLLNGRLKDNPEQRAVALVWRAGANTFHAIKAREAGNNAEYAARYARAIADYDAADTLKSPDVTVQAVGGGVGVFFADRLAPADRAALWQRTYGYYQVITTRQAAVADRLPPHLRGESYGGLVTAAQRTGRTAEAAAGLEKMLTLVKDTPYEETALKWKADMSIAPNTNLACKNCHDANRLAPTLQRLTEREAATRAKTATP